MTMASSFRRPLLDFRQPVPFQGIGADHQQAFRRARAANILERPQRNEGLAKALFKSKQASTLARQKGRRLPSGVP